MAHSEPQGKPKKTTKSEDNLWPPPCPERCPNCGFTMSRAGSGNTIKRAVLVEELGYWYCLECATKRALALGIKMIEQTEN